MSSFVFNKFKERFIKGEVPNKDNWYFIPVNDTFKNTFDTDNFGLEQYRGLSDFKDVSSEVFSYSITNVNNVNNPPIGEEKAINMSNAKICGTGLIEGKKVNYDWTKVIDDGTLNDKPMFITNENYNNFLAYFSNTVKDNPHIADYLAQGGFYFIRTKSELEWFANRSIENTRIIGVIGDPIEGVINVPIGGDEKRPFEGILDGNYFSIKVTIKAQNNDNGIVGVLGQFGVVRNFKFESLNISDENNIVCEKPITLSHIKNDGRDINCGLLVGRNYGTIENIDASELKTFNLSGFVPSVYSVTNKSDNYKWNETENIVRKKFDDTNENFFYLNSFCINSPGNICPYVGYFNEGKFADDAAAFYADASTGLTPTMTAEVYDMEYSHYIGNWGTKNNNIDNSFSVELELTGDDPQQLDETRLFKINYYPLGNFSANSPDSTVEKIDISKLYYNINKNNVSGLISNPYYYGFDNFGYLTVRGVGKNNIDDEKIETSSIIENYNSNLVQKTFGSAYSHNFSLEPSYETTRCSMRMHPQARAAYNVGVIVGANYGTIKDVQVNTIIKNKSNFVGFIGGLVGKQAQGTIDNVSVSVDNEFEYDFANTPSAGDVVYYKQTPYFPEVIKTYIETTLSSSSLTPSQYSDAIDTLCTPWSADSVNTAKQITDDVVSYKLRPIFVVGGLFGRYVPTFGVNFTIGTDLKCKVRNSTVLYKDNYYSTNCYKRSENSFGVLVGKVDCATNSNNFYIDDSLICTNCEFKALSYVGEPYQYFQYNFNSGYIPVVNADGSLASGINSGSYVGIFEIKNNIIDPISYTVNSAKTRVEGDGNDDEWTELSTKKSISEVGLYYAGDYPIDMSSHYGGIEKSHNMLSFIPDNESTSGNLRFSYYVTTPLPTEVTAGPWDITHMYYLEPNYDKSTNSGGVDKRNIANRLIRFDNCKSNVNNWVELYDDYFNTWNFQKLPPQFQSKTTFTNNDIFALTKYWNNYRTNTRGIYNAMDLSAVAEWSESDIETYNWEDYGAIYVSGQPGKHLNSYITKGTQNTFDGYTTVDFEQTVYYNSMGEEEDFVTTITTDNKPGSRNTWYRLPPPSAENFGYTNPRIYRKNIIKEYNSMWDGHVENTEYINYRKNIVTGVKRDNGDDYYYYTYDIKENDINSAHSEYTSLESAFVFSSNVEFTTATKGLKNKNMHMGYTIPMTTDEMDSNSAYISIGEYYEPSAIRNHINNAPADEKGYRHFTTTSISSMDNFGGLLVVDSSGRNVMFLDNEQNTPLTGNSIVFSAERAINNKNKFILKV